MKVTLKDILESKGSLERLMVKDLPVKASFKMKGLFKKIEKELDLFNEEQIKLLNKYGKEKEKGKYEFDTIEDRENYNKDLKDLLSIEIEIEFTKIKVDDLGDISMSVQDSLMLEKFIDG